MTDTPIDTVDTTAAAETPQTVMDVFKLIYATLNEAGKVCNEYPDRTADLALALDKVPQPVVDQLVVHLKTCFESMEGMKLIGITFAPSEDTKFCISTAHMQFGPQVLPFIAPYGPDALKELHTQIGAVLNKLAAPSLILPN